MMFATFGTQPRRIAGTHPDFFFLIIHSDAQMTNALGPLFTNSLLRRIVHPTLPYGMINSIEPNLISLCTRGVTGEWWVTDDYTCVGTCMVRLSLLCLFGLFQTPLVSTFSALGD